ncbi:hypothetical protein D3C75_856960 [compost metagenome]
MLQGLGVMQSQAFHVDHFQPSFTDARRHHGQMRQLAIGEYVASNELSSTAAYRATVDMLGRNTMVHHQATLSHCCKQALAIQLQIGMANVFEHANADHFVKAAILGQFSIVEQLEFHQVFQAICLDARTSQFQLLFAQGNTQYFCAEVPGGITGQASPATADIQQVVAGLQSQLATQVVELLVLGYLQAFLTRFEIGARVSHVLVKPELVELVGKIVVVGNSLGVGRLVMDLAQRKVAFVITHQRHAQLITNPHNFFD